MCGCSELYKVQRPMVRNPEQMDKAQAYLTSEQGWLVEMAGERGGFF